MNTRRLIIGIVVLAIILVGGYLIYSQFIAPSAEETAETETVDVNEISVETNLDTVAAEGQIVPLDDTMLSFQLGGQVEAILVAEGDTVVVGDALIQLDTTDQELALTQAETGVIQAQANLQTAQAGMLSAQAGLQAAEVAVKSAEAQLALLQSGATDEQIAVSEAGAAVAQAAVNQAAGNRDASLESASAASIRAAEAGVAAAQAQYNATLRQYQGITQDPDEDATLREQAQLQINAAQANLNSAQAALDELRAGATTAEQVAANSGVASAQDQFEAAEANLALLLAGTREEQIAVAEVGITQAQNSLDEAEIQVAVAETGVTRAEAAVGEAEAARDAAQIALEKRTLISPFAGTVASIPVKEGEVVSSGFPVITIADFSEWQIETTDLTELSVVAIARDFPVEINIDAFPGETLTGKVVDIASVSDIVRGDVTYVTTIALDDDQGLPLRWGMTAFVTVDTK